MLIELFYPVMPGFAVLFIALNMFQLHFIVNKLASPITAEPCVGKSGQSAPAVADADSSRRTGPNSDQPAPATAGTNESQKKGQVDRLKWLKSLWKWLVSELPHPLYVAVLFVATLLLFSVVFMLPGARATATGLLPLEYPRMIFSFLAVTKLYYMPAFVSHVWLASMLFVVQAMIKYWQDRRRIDGWICYPDDHRVPQVFESVTLILGLLSLLIGIATPQMLGQLR